MLLKKYIPKKVSDIVGQYKGIVKLSRFAKGDNPKKAAIIYGGPGIGKTLAARVFTSENDFELFEIPPSSTRDKKAILEKLKPATQQPSLFGGNKVILIDELESFSDRGGISALIDIIKNTKFPVILTANDPWKSKFRNIRKYCEMIEFSSIDYKEIEKYLSKICESENIEVEPVVLKKLAARSRGDVRSAVLDLEVLSKDKTKIRDEDVYELFRERDENIFYAVKMVLKSFDARLAYQSLIDSKVDSSEFMLWLDQNLPQEYLEPRSLRDAYIEISRSDIFSSRIVRNQAWGLMFYSKLFVTSGVQQAKSQVSQNISHYSRPDVLMKIFEFSNKRRKMRGIVDQVSGKLHASTTLLMRDFYPYFNFIHEKNPKMGKALTKYLDSD